MNIKGKLIKYLLIPLIVACVAISFLDETDEKKRRSTFGGLAIITAIVIFGFKATERPCSYCKQVTKRVRFSSYCSTRCRTDANPKRKVPCGYCGREIINRVGNDFCSIKCCNSYNKK